ncbi:FtsX-like permease family protein [Streptomyces sp. NPDC047043]|uniref:FtsX-like permease family protein n=1 Tax=Streptomyces sp. NPDC047043 TaxID=3154497 RepID=UPI003407E28B
MVGVYRTFPPPPTDPLSETVTSLSDIPAPLPPPDFYLADVASGGSPGAGADQMRQEHRPAGYGVATLVDRVRQQRDLTALNLDGLSRIEAVSSATVAALGVGLLGAFLVMERRREYAVLRTVGAGTGRVLTGPVVEDAVAVVGSLLIGIPLGLGLGVLSIRVLSLFFTLPPPLVTVPASALVLLAGLVVAISAPALGLALRRIDRSEVTTLLREP